MLAPASAAWPTVPGRLATTPPCGRPRYRGALATAGCSVLGSVLGCHRSGRKAVKQMDLQTLERLNGLPQIELYTVEDTGNGASGRLAAEIFQDAGFVLLPKAVDLGLCHELLEACREEERAMLLRDPGEDGNRGQGRYSLGEAQRTGHLLHRMEWAKLVDLARVTPVLQQIFQGDSYVCAGAGGDFVRPGVTEYQPLHVDLNFPGCHACSNVGPPVVTLNVALEPLSWLNGPTRIVPGTHRIKEGWSENCWEPPEEAQEPEDWKFYTFCPLPAGTVILRDNRAWHGGTPNLSASTRFLPNVEFAASWWCVGDTEELWRNPWKLAPRCMPRQVWNRLSPYAQDICRMVVTDRDLDYGVRDGFSYRR